MSNEEIKQRIQRILKENISISQHGYMNGLADLEGIEDAAKAIATFYEQSILPEVLKEKDAKIEKTQEIANHHYAKRAELESQLSQLQSKMEEEKRQLKVIVDCFERFIPKEVALDNAKEMAMYEGYHRAKKLIKSTTQSTESGNLNKQ